MKVTSIILKPIVTEKSYELASKNVYAFKVAMSANKYAVAKEMKRMYDVDAVRVRVMINPGKRKRLIGERSFIKTPNWKKVLVEVKEGQKIDIFPKE